MKHGNPWSMAIHEEWQFMKNGQFMKPIHIHDIRQKNGCLFRQPHSHDMSVLLIPKPAFHQRPGS